VHIGQGNIPEGRDPLLHHRGDDRGAWLRKLEGALAAAAEGLPTHQVWIDRHCKAVAG
jgi:tryptophan 7-halogenase